MTVVSVDPRQEPGAYISHDGKLYQVEYFEATGANSGKLWVVNAKTEHRMWLTASEAGHAVLERPAPELELPDVID